MGQCSGSPLFECVCSLGWTSDPATLVLSGVECDVDCGCNFHSTCITAPGICDECQGVRLHSISAYVDGSHLLASDPSVLIGFLIDNVGCLFGTTHFILTVL